MENCEWICFDPCISTVNGQMWPFLNILDIYHISYWWNYWDDWDWKDCECPEETWNKATPSFSLESHQWMEKNGGQMGHNIFCSCYKVAWFCHPFYIGWRWSIFFSIGWGCSFDYSTYNIIVALVLWWNRWWWKYLVHW